MQLLYVIAQVFAQFGKLSGRVWLNHGLYFGKTLFTCLSSLTKKRIFWKQKSLDVRLLERTHAPISRAWEAAVTAHVLAGICNECVLCFVFSPFDFLWSNTMIPRWWKFYFCKWRSREEPNHWDFIWNHDTVTISWKITTIIWPAIGWNHLQGW